MSIARRTWEDVKGKGLGHWLFVFAVIFAGIAISHHLDKTYFALATRYKTYQALQSTDPRRPIKAWNVVVISVGDDEFWKGELNRRIPVKRDYLARLIKALDTADPAVIAIDYTLRSPVADGTLPESPDYRSETDQLVEAIEEVSPHRRMVLPVTFDEGRFDPVHQTYPMDSAVYSDHKFQSRNVRLGYTNLPLDTRRVPITSKVREWKGVLRQENPLTSFALAVALAWNPGISFPKDLEEEELPRVIYGHFMSENEFSTVAAADVLHKPASVWQDKVQHRVAVVGSFAHRDAFGRGRYVDGFLTPVGTVPGVIVHANYIEAWIDSRAVPLLPDWLDHTLEGLISLAVSILFVRRMGARRKLLSLVLVFASAALVSYLVLQLLGAFFDPYLPALFVILHGSVDKVFEWRAAAHANAIAG